VEEGVRAGWQKRPDIRNDTQLTQLGVISNGWTLLPAELTGETQEACRVGL